jgi:peptidoglycan/LPS O-acetylase OafA/YrhL
VGLTIFFVAAKLLRRVDPRLQLALSGALSAVALSIAWSPTMNLGWEGAMKYSFFFLSGIYLRSRILTLGTHHRKTVMAVTLVTWVVVSVTVAVFDLRTVPGLFFANCCLGVLARVVAARAVSGLEPPRRIGSNTLPIYLAHTPIVIVITTLVPLLGAVTLLNLVSPVVLALVATVLSVALYRATGSSSWRYLYEPPPRRLPARTGDPA